LVKATLRKIEQAAGCGLVSGALICIVYTLPSTQSDFRNYFHYLAGFSVAMACYFVIDLFQNTLPKPLFILGLLSSGFFGGATSFLLSPRTISIGWHLAGGVILFLFFWYAELRDARIPPAA